MTLADDRAASRGPAPDRAAVERGLRAWGHEPAPPPSAAFLAGLEARLLDDDGPVEVTIRPGLAPVVPLRRKVGITAVAAAGALFVAGAAAAMGGLTRDDGVRVEPTIDRTATTAPSVNTAAPSSTAARPPVVVTVPAAAAGAPAGGASPGPVVVVPSPAAVPPSTTSAPVDRPSSSVEQPRPSTTPATTAAPVATAPVTTRPAEPPPPTAPPTLPATTTTEVHTAATMTLTCAAQVVDARPAVVCEWSEPVGGAASYRLLRSVAGQPTGRVFTPAAGTRRYVDYDAVATGTTYRYTAQALDAAGTVVAHSATATVVR